MKQLTAVCIVFLGMWSGILFYQEPVFSFSLVGFKTNGTGYFTLGSPPQEVEGDNQLPPGQTAVLDFGSLHVTNAKVNGVVVTQLIGADVLISDITVNLNTRTVLASFGTVDYTRYLTIPQIPILDGFKIKIGNDIVMSADLLLYDVFLFGKTGTLDPVIQLNLLNPQITTSDPILSAFFNGFSFGADLNITLEDINGGNIDDDIMELNDINGLVGGTFSSLQDEIPIPEPVSGLLLLAGCLSLKLKRASFTIRS
ncbi:hypothetical protein KDK77_03725 [bacterium]|nr:hypothetical protein [bacterium]